MASLFSVQAMTFIGIPSGGQDEEKRQELFRLAMRGKWKEVISHYEKYPDLQDKPLTRAEDTTLHVAISAGDEHTVIQLLAVLKKETKGMDGFLPKKNDDGSTPMVRTILEMQNESGSTPMHLAAALGMERACWEMASLCPDLVTTVRNKKGETPLFTAVQHGKKEAFFALEHWVQKLENYLLTLKNTNTLENNILPVQSLENKEKRVRDLTHCRRDKDGNNIFHCAIFGEYFDLAYEIIHLYPELINYVNAKGETPLNYLANKPSCFRSGIRFGFFDTVIYYCIIIGPLRRKFENYKDHRSDKPLEYASEDPILPATWDTFSLIFTFIKSILYNDPRKNKKDEENKKNEENKKDEEDKKLPFPEIYEVGVALFKLVMKVLLVILGIGLRRTQTLERKKRKNTYASQLMNELVERSKAWEYEKDGKDPRMSSSISDSDLLSEPPADETYTNPKSPTQQDQFNFVSKNRKPESSERAVSGGGSKHAGIKWNLRILDKEKTIYGDIYVPEEDASNEPDRATPVLVAAKNGITELVEKILNTFPVAVLDLDKDEKNILLLAVEYRQSDIYAFMDKRKIMRDSVFGRVDKDGNSALHLAAKLSQKIPWSIRGAALQMQWEIKWYKYVMQSMEIEFFANYNNEGQTAEELFIDKHKDLIKEAGDWLFNTSESCSVVAALIAGVAFASAATVPGGLNQDSGDPILSGKVAFEIFAFASLVALCFSVTSLIMFLTILTSRYQAEDFERSLPAKLILGLTSLFASIAAMLVSFCAGNFFVVESKLKYVAYPIYGVMFLPVCFFALAQLPLYLDLVWATIMPVPERAQKMRAF